MSRSIFMIVLLAALSAHANAALAHRFITQGNDKLLIVAADGTVEWKQPWGPIHDIHVLPNGHVMVQKGPHAVVEIDPQTRDAVWEYNSATSNGNAGRPVEVHSFQPLADGRVMIAESGPARIIEIDRTGRLLHEIEIKVDHPDPHRDTRLVRKLASGNYLVCHEGDGAVREYDGRTGAVVWEYDVPLFGRERRDGHGPKAFGNQVFAAVRLPSGNTLIATGNGHSVLEVTPAKKTVWRLEQHDLPTITLAWVTTLEVLPNGHYVIGNCHAGPENPSLIEIDPKTKKVVWSFKRFEFVGNDCSNSQLLDLEQPANR